MGVLTEHATRLCREITFMREARQTLLAEVRRATQFRRVAVLEMLAGFSKAQSVAGGRRKTDLVSSLRRLRGGVNQLRKGISDDLVGIRETWLGTRPARHGGILIQMSPDVETHAEAVETMEEEPRAEPLRAKTTKVTEKVARAEPATALSGGTVSEAPPTPEETREPDVSEVEAGVAAKTDSRPQKRKRKH
jgi:hypothetical protein